MSASSAKVAVRTRVFIAQRYLREQLIYIHAEIKDAGSLVGVVDCVAYINLEIPVVLLVIPVVPDLFERIGERAVPGPSIDVWASSHPEISTTFASESRGICARGFHQSLCSL